VQGSFEHLHVLLLVDCKWVKRSSNNLCVEELFKGTTITTTPSGKLEFHRPQLFQVPLCAISFSYYFCCWVLVVVVVCGEREDNVATLVWCMGTDQLMMGGDELVGLKLVGSSHNNGSYFARCLLSTMCHNYVIFLTTLVDFVTCNFVLQELLLVLICFFPLPNKNFQGFNNVATNYYWTLLVVFISPTSFHTFI